MDAEKLLFIYFMVHLVSAPTLATVHIILLVKEVNKALNEKVNNYQVDLNLLRYIFSDTLSKTAGVSGGTRDLTDTIFMTVIIYGLAPVMLLAKLIISTMDLADSVFTCVNEFVNRDFGKVVLFRNRDAQFMEELKKQEKTNGYVQIKQKIH